MKQFLPVRVLLLILFPLIVLFLGKTSATISSQNVGGNLAYLPLLTTPAPEQWIKNYDMAGADYSAVYRDLVLTTENDILLVGQSSDGQASDAVVTRTGSNGEPLWNRVFSTGGAEQFSTTAQALDGGLWVGGELEQEGEQYGRPWLLRLDANGAVLWQKTYVPPTPSPYGAGVSNILVTADGGVLIAIDDKSWYGIWIVKLTSDGTVSWVREFSEHTILSSNWLARVQQTLDGGYILAGVTMINNEDFAWVVKINNNGAVLWQRAYGLPGQDFGNNTTFGVEVLNDGSYFLGVRIRIDPSNETWAIRILRLNGNGDAIWHKSFDIGGSRVHGMALTQDQGLVVIGGDPYPSNIRPWIFKINNNGALLWKYFYGGVQGFDWPGSAIAVQEMSSGDIIVAGSEDYQYDDGFLVMRLTAQGTIPYCTLLTDVPVVPVTAVLNEQVVNVTNGTALITVANVNIPSSTPTLEIQTICPQAATQAMAMFPGQVEYC